MPCLRGIDVKLVTYPAKQIFLEYPHPDGSSLRLVTREEASSSGHAASIRKADPKSSVYIATQPAAQFIIAYDINEIPKNCKYLNFKVIVNGRHMVTCGRDLEEKTRGVICQTLWAPSNHRDQYSGIEGRQFVFLPDETTKSAAEDGGLIEVQVHRAVARSLRSPALQDFRPAPEYGLATPSTGLIDRPQNVEWYKYHLVDPKDTPYARFFFHYRSYDSLKDLNLIPEKHIQEPKQTPEKTPCPSSKQQQALDEVEEPPRTRPHEASYLWLDGATDEDRPVARISGRRETNPTTQHTNPPRQHSRARRGDDAPDSAPAGQHDIVSAISERPLPDLPFGGLPAPSRRAAKSPAPSLTPSLKRSVDNGDFDDDIEIAEPKVVRYSKVLDKPILMDVAPGRNSTSSFDLLRPDSTIYRPSPGPTRHSYQPANSAAPVHDLRSFSSRRLDIHDAIGLAQATGGRASWLPPRVRPYSGPKSYGPARNRAAKQASRQQGRPRDEEMVSGVMGREEGQPAQPLGLTAPIYRGADRTGQLEGRLPPLRPRPGELSLSSATYSTHASGPSTYSALRDVGAAMISGSTFRRNDRDAQVQSTTDRGSARDTRHTQGQPSPDRGTLRSSMQSWTSRASTSATPIRASYADQRWSPRNAPPDSQSGVSWEQMVRESDHRPSTIDHMISELNGSDDAKENRPPTEDEE